jgi:L-rhamnose mutarotase
MKRFGYTIGVREDKLEEYQRLHVEVWPAVNAAMSACHLRNFTIFLRRFPDGKHYLFMYYEYAGDDYAADMRRMAADRDVQEWWQHTAPCQEPLVGLDPSEWWAAMTEVCHND